MTLEIYYSTMVRRWHTNPHMSHTVDPTGYHSGRMAILALAIWPDASRDLLASCLTHDLGEYASGDIPWGSYDVKREADRFADEWSSDNGIANYLSLKPHERVKLKFLDRLDAYLWARHHNAEYVNNSVDWKIQRDSLHTQAKELGVDLCQFNM